MFDLLKRLLLSERGAIGDESDPDLAAPAPDGDTGTGVQDDAALAEGEQADLSGTAATPQGDDSTFLEASDLNPKNLPKELQPIFKRMQGVYTKKMQSVAELRDKAAQVDRFYTDPEFAQQTLIGWAAQNGYQLTPVGQAQQQGQQQQAGQARGNVPPQLVEAFKQNLAPELQWMAEPQAAATWQVMQQMLQPVFQQQTQAQQQQRVQEWDKHAEQLAEVAPGWEEQEDLMSDIHDFMKSDSLYHPQFGSKLQMYYDLATARAASLKQATERVNGAAKNRVSSGRSGTRQPQDLTGRMQKASTQDAWKLAVQHALSQHNTNGE